MTHKATSMAFYGFTPGPDGAGAVCMPTANPVHARLRHGTAMDMAAPVQQLTPDQAFFRDSVAQGRLAAYPLTGAHAPVHRIRQHPNGVTDVTRLEPNGNDYIDLGGKGGVDMAVRQP